jgi:PhnB protein
MAQNVKPVPEGTHTLTVHLIVREATKAIDFYQKGLGAKLQHVHNTPGGKVMHAALQIGDSQFALADEFPGMSLPAPQTLGGSPVVMNLYVEDVDALFSQAVAAGATARMPLANQFWGDRYGQITDPFGHTWALATHVENVAPDEMARRADALFAQMSKKAGA